MSQINITNPHKRQILVIRLRMKCSELGSNLISKIKSKLNETYAGKCYQNIFVRNINKIVEVIDNEMSSGDMTGEPVFKVKVEADVSVINQFEQIVVKYVRDRKGKPVMERENIKVICNSKSDLVLDNYYLVEITNNPLYNNILIFCSGEIIKHVNDEDIINEFYS